MGAVNKHPNCVKMKFEGDLTSIMVTRDFFWDSNYCNFTNFRCVKISVSSDHGAFGVVLISVSVDVVVITQCIFLI